MEDAASRSGEECSEMKKSTGSFRAPRLIHYHDATLDGRATRKVPSEHVNLAVRESCLNRLPPTGSVAVIPISLDPAGLMLFSPSPRMCQAANRTCDYE